MSDEARAVPRAAFEAWVSAPPIEARLDRYPDSYEQTAWPGQYCEYRVQLAWEAWAAGASWAQRAWRANDSRDR